MKILLAAINAKYIHSNLAVYSLKAFSAEFGEQIEIREYTINQQMDEILRDIYRREPDVIAFSCYIWNRSMVGAILRELPKILPKVVLWVGGPEVSYNARQFLEEFPHISGVMRGEGEEIFQKLADYYIEETGFLSKINGLTYRGEDGEIYETPPSAPLDLDKLPFPYINLKKFEHKIIYYESSRGCPFSCSYCLSSIDKTIRFRSLETVKRELSQFLEAKIQQVKFVDRTFNCNLKRAREIWEWITEHDNGITNFHFEIAADLITDKELDLMRHMRPGLIQLEIGVQSTNLETIREIDRTMNLEKLFYAVKKIQGFGNIHQHLDLIAGLPKENLESFQKSFDEIFPLKPDQLQLGFLKVLKGTKMDEKAEEYHIRFHSTPPYEVFCTAWLSYQDILVLKGVEEMLEVYYNSHQFSNTLQEILKRYDSPFAFFHELAVYYEDRGYMGLNHSRIARYEILREFLAEKGWTSSVYDQCMVFDLYLRENLKSRPAFAKDLSMHKTKLKEYTREYGKQIHVDIFEYQCRHVFVLFDYCRKNPLTGEAYVEVLGEV